MSPDIVIERASGDDIGEMLQIERDSFALAWTEDMLMSYLRGKYSAILKASAPDGGVLGFACIIFVAGEGYLDNLAVRSDMRRRSIAGGIVSAVINMARFEKLDRLMLEVRASNKPAILLYEKYGFTRAGVRKGYYDSPKEDAVLMELTL